MLQHDLTVFSTWARRCDKVVFVTEEDDEELPVMKVNVTGRENLWGKTKTSLARAYREYGAHVDWVLKVTLWIQFLLYARPLQADHDTYIVMENLREFLGDFNSSQSLCRLFVHL